MTQFSELCLSPTMLEAIEDLGYTEPTPIQEQAIPLALGGRDIIAGAQTGTGKTAAFCLPCMDTLPHAPKHGGPLMLVITPTRELADQIEEVCTRIARHTKHKITKVVGGVSYNPQRNALERGTDILIATPGRLEDLMGQGVAKLEQVQVVVLDEADRMLDMGFLPSIDRIVDECTGEHQTLLFSATIDENVTEVARRMLRDPEQIEVARRGDTAATIEQYIVRIAHAAKPEALKAILEQYGSRRVIVFARTRHRADTCARKLKRFGYKVDTIHSDRSQAQRRKALAAFDKGEVNVLVATDVLARGIDIDQVDYVVNYDMPTQPEDYVHRIGRTGRAGADGLAISLVSPDNRSILRDVQRLIDMQLPELELENLDVETAEQMAKVKAEYYAEENAKRASEGGKAKKGDKKSKKGKGKKNARSERKHDDEQRDERAEDATREGAERKAPKGDKGGKGRKGAKSKGFKGKKGHGKAEHKRDEAADERRFDERPNGGKGRKGDKKRGGKKRDFKRDDRGERDTRAEQNTRGNEQAEGKSRRKRDEYRRPSGNGSSKRGKGRKGDKRDERDERRESTGREESFGKKRGGRNGGKSRGKFGGNGGGSSERNENGYKPKRGRNGSGKGSYGKGRKGAGQRDDRHGGFDKPKRGKFSPGRFSSSMHR